MYLNRSPFNVFLDHPIHPPKTNADPWDCEFLPDLEDHVIKMVNGVYQVFRNKEDVEANNPASGYDYPDLDTYVTDMQLMCALIADGPLKSFCYRRLSYLSSKFQLHVLLNELRELAAQKAVAHRDFYNVRKVFCFFGRFQYLTRGKSLLESWGTIFLPD